MHEFLADNAAFAPIRKIVVVPILDPDLHRNWIGAASAHVSRRGHTLRGIAAFIKERDPFRLFTDLHWTDVRDCILGRPSTRNQEP